MQLVPRTETQIGINTLARTARDRVLNGSAWRIGRDGRAKHGLLGARSSPEQDQERSVAKKHFVGYGRPLVARNDDMFGCCGQEMKIYDPVTLATLASTKIIPIISRPMLILHIRCTCMEGVRMFCIK